MLGKSKAQKRAEIKTDELYRKKFKLRNKLRKLHWKIFNDSVKNNTKQGFNHVNNLDNSFGITPQLAHFSNMYWGNILDQNHEEVLFYKFVLDHCQVKGFPMAGYVENNKLFLYYFDFGDDNYNVRGFSKEEHETLRADFGGKIGIEDLVLDF